MSGTEETVKQNKNQPKETIDVPITPKNIKEELLGCNEKVHKEDKGAKRRMKPLVVLRYEGAISY